MKKQNKLFGIIGIGGFGLSVALQLLEKHKSVIAIDRDEARLRELEDTNAKIFIIDELTKKALEETGLKECDVIIVGIGGINTENNIIATLFSLELGVPKVISKAMNEDHMRILEKLGAETVYPEVDEGRRLAMTLSSRYAEEVVPLSDEFMIIQVKVPEHFDNKTVIDLDLRKKFGVNIVAITDGERTTASISPDTVIHKNDILALSGPNKALERIQAEFNKYSE